MDAGPGAGASCALSLGSDMAAGEMAVGLSSGHQTVIWSCGLSMRSTPADSLLGDAQGRGQVEMH